MPRLFFLSSGHWERPEPTRSILFSAKTSSPGHEGSVKPPGHLAPQLLLGLSEGVKTCSVFGSVLWEVLQ